MKECFKCLKTKELTEFYKHPTMSGGRVGKCKVCNKADNTANRLLRLEKYREYDRVRGNRQSPEYLVDYMRKNPKKHKAHALVSSARRSGKLVPQPCEVCQADKAHAHHDDYNKPLDVRWLCAAHHRQWHCINGEGIT